MLLGTSPKRSLAFDKRVTKNTEMYLEVVRSSNPSSNKKSTSRDFLSVYNSDRFVEAVLKHAKNEKEKPIRVNGWFRQYLRFLGDFRIATKAIPGCQQSGKSLGCSLLLSFCAIELGLVMLYTYDSQGARDTQVKRNLQPILSQWENSRFIEKRRNLSDNLEIWESQSGGIVQFLYSSVNSASKNVASRKGLANAGGKNVGYQADGLIDEERSQSPPGARDPFKRRTVESTLKPHPPHVILGTPGGGLGIEYELQKIEHHFAPYYDCPECGVRKPLHPKGCLLKPVMKTVAGEEVDTWFTESGKPIEWFYHDQSRPEATAYVGCSECGHELDEEIRTNAIYRECRFDIGLNIVQDIDRSLDEFLDSLPDGAPTDHLSAALWISPLTRDGNPAPSIIREGNTSANTSDWQQQNLGITSEVGASGISVEQMRKAIGLKLPEREPDVRLASLDQGRQEDWLWITDIWLPERWQTMKIPEILDKAIRGVVFGEAVNRTAIIPTLNVFTPGYGLMDNEPDIPDAVNISRNTIFELADQAGNKCDIDKVKRETSGLSYDLWIIRQKDFQDRVANGFVLAADDGLPLYRLPKRWEKWIPLIGNEQSPITHMTSMQKDPETRLWIRPDNHVDDHFFAAMFMEAALAVWLKTKVFNNSYSVGKARW